MSFVQICDLNMKREFVRFTKNSNKENVNDSKKRVPNTK